MLGKGHFQECPSAFSYSCGARAVNRAAPVPNCASPYPISPIFLIRMVAGRSSNGASANTTHGRTRLEIREKYAPRPLILLLLGGADHLQTNTRVNRAAGSGQRSFLPSNRRRRKPIQLYVAEMLLLSILPLERLPPAPPPLFPVRNPFTHSNRNCLTLS